MRKLVLAITMILAGAASMTAQTKQETSLYNKTLAKPSVKAYEKFLKKFPSSQFAAEIMTLRDSTLFEAVDKTDALAVEAFAQKYPESPIMAQVEALIEKLNTSDLDNAQALAVVKALAPDAVEAFGYRKSGVDYVYSVGMTGQSINVYKCTMSKGGEWSLETIPVERYTLDPTLDATAFDGAVTLEKLNSRKYLAFNYLNTLKGSSNVEYVASVYDLENSSVSSAMFYGKDMASKKDAYKIEGQSPEEVSLGGLTAETAYLLSKIKENPLLVPIAKADALTDDSIAWWLEKNPTAATKASHITFGALDEESSLVAGYKKTSSKDKDSSNSYTAALFDIRGYTVVVAYNKAQKTYSLAWAEPVCKNKKTDKLLNSIYFRDTNNLTLYYYKGNTTFKYELNLATKVIRR